MALITPTTAEVNANIIAQLEASLGQTVPLLPKSFLRVLAKILAALFIILYKYSGFIFLQLFVSTASDQETEVNGSIITPLTEWGRLIGVGDPGVGVAAQLTINITVTNQTGTLASGSQLVNTSNGVTYITIGAVLLNAATVIATIRAVNDQTDGGGIGTVGNLDPGDVVSFANTLANVNRDTEVLALVITGTDPETSDEYRTRIITRFQSTPQGGAYADYRVWGGEVEGVNQIYPYTSDTPGIVDVFVEADVSVDADGIAPPALITSVFDAIELLRPANAFVDVVSITRTGFDVLVTGLSVDDLAGVQASINTAVTEYFVDRAPFIVGLDILPRRETITQSALIGLVEDIVTGAGGTFTTVQFDTTIAGTLPPGITTFTLGNGELSKLSTSVAFA